MPEKRSKQKANEKKEWPAVVYFWAFGLAVVSYMIVEVVFIRRCHIQSTG